MKITVIAHPNSKKQEIVKDLEGTLHIYTKEPAQEGRANKTIIEALAKHFDVSKSQVKLVKGHKSKQKIFEINSTE